MSRVRWHHEWHAVQHIGWLRAAVLGANDGLLSTASLIVGVAGAGSGQTAILLAGAAGLIAGALSMASGEYVSVSSQSDLEVADLAREAAELEADPEAEHRELAHIYVKRGVTPATASAVSEELMAHDALAAHALDELGLAESTAAQPMRAAFTSAASFFCGAAVPLMAAWLSPLPWITRSVVTVTIFSLAALGAFGAKTAGASIVRSIRRAVILGCLNLLISTSIGRFLGTSIG